MVERCAVALTLADGGGGFCKVPGRRLLLWRRRLLLLQLARALLRRRGLLMLMLELRLRLRLLIQLMLLELLELLAAIKSGRWHANDGGVLHRRGADAGRARVKQESRTSTSSGLLLLL